MTLDMGDKRISRDEPVAAVSFKPTNSERSCFKLTHLRRKGLIYPTHPITVLFVDCLRVSMEMSSLEFMHLTAGVHHQAAQKLALTSLTEVTGRSV